MGKSGFQVLSLFGEKYQGASKNPVASSSEFQILKRASTASEIHLFRFANRVPRFVGLQRETSIISEKPRHNDF